MRQSCIPRWNVKEKKKRGMWEGERNADKNYIMELSSCSTTHILYSNSTIKAVIQKEAVLCLHKKLVQNQV